MSAKPEIPEVLLNYIATRDKRLNDPVTQTRLLETFRELIAKGRVEVGGRAACGSKCDPTWKTFTAWNEVVRKAMKIGYEIKSAPVKHANKSPTMAGGFWESNIYELVGCHVEN
jgi:hypothetical protein